MARSRRAEGRCRANRDARGKRHVFPLPIFRKANRERDRYAPLRLRVLCGSLSWFAKGRRSLLTVFSFAANSCFTLRAMASVFTLYVLAASRRTVAVFVLDAASRMAVSIIRRESVLSSARRRNAAKVFASPPSSRFCRMPCCRASVSMRRSSMKVTSFSRMNSRSRFIRRTGTAALTAARTRRPVALAMACSFRYFFCSAFHFSSSRLVFCLG